MKRNKIFLTLLLSFLFSLKLSATLPFVTTTITDGTFAANTMWYTIKIGSSGLVISDNGTANFISLSTTRSLYEDADLWCFVGNDTTGYRIYNKQAGSGKVLASPKTMSGTTGATAYVVLKDEASLPSTYTADWLFAASTNLGSNVNAQYMYQKGVTSNKVNNRDNKLAFWTTGADHGSSLLIELAYGVYDLTPAAGTYTASNSTGTFHATWQSTVTPNITLSCGKNNMATATNGNFDFYVGQTSPCTYTISAPSGYIVDGFRFEFVETAGQQPITVTVGDHVFTSSETQQHAEMSGLEEQTATFGLSGVNKSIEVTNFQATIRRLVPPQEPNFEVFPTLNVNAIPYRIPAIATAHNGDIIAVADYRHCRSDIGAGRIDLHGRISHDNGATWGDIFTIVTGGTNDGFHNGFGDPCIVADRESDEVLLMSCAGDIMFPSGTRDHHQGIAVFRSHDNGATWSEPTNIAESVYSLFDSHSRGPIRSMFIGSGKIHQSRYTKVGNYYRLYCVGLVKDKNSTNDNVVFYSDDFGATWNKLGGDNCFAVPGGDEPKAEELPDGSIILSSRCTGGRYFNIFTFTDSERAQGRWTGLTFSGSGNNGTTSVSCSCNGEILIVPALRKSDNKDVYLALQSVPFGSGRSNVGIYYKELENLSDFNASASFARDWDGSHRSTTLGSAYSTMCLQNDDHVGFLYEEETYCGTGGGGYTIIYKNYSLEQLTDSAYSLKRNINRDSLIMSNVDIKKAGLFDGGDKGYVGMPVAGEEEKVETALQSYKNDPATSTYEAINAAIQDMQTVQIEEGKWYRLRNTNRHNGQYYLVANSMGDGFTAAARDTLTASEVFSFHKSASGWLLYSDNRGIYMTKSGTTSSATGTTNEVNDNNSYRVESSFNGESSLISMFPGNGTHNSAHLDAQDKVVAWTASNSPASHWYIEPLEEISVSIPAYGYTTMYFPFPIIPSSDLTFFRAQTLTPSGEESEVAVLEELTDLSIIPANTPLVIRGDEGIHNLLVGDGNEETEAVTGNSLVGVLSTHSISDRTTYVINNTDATGTVFKRQLTGSVASNKAYLPSESNQLQLEIRTDINVGLKPVLTAKKKPLFYYDLKGVRHLTPQKGVNITSDGRKIMR